MNTTENNKIIAEFMYINKISSKVLRNAMLNGLEYHSSWDWLMEVVEKIESILIPETDNCFNVTIGSGLYCTIQDAYGELIEISTDGKTKIETVYNGCIEFIEWYNEQNK